MIKSYEIDKIKIIFTERIQSYDESKSLCKTFVRARWCNKGHCYRTFGRHRLKTAEEENKTKKKKLSDRMFCESIIIDSDKGDLMQRPYCFLNDRNSRVRKKKHRDNNYI